MITNQNEFTLVTLLQHYIWLTVFGWMAAEGLYLYRMVHSVFVTHGGGYVTKLAIIVWGKLFSSFRLTLYYLAT